MLFLKRQSITLLVVLNFRLVAKLRDPQSLLTLSLFCNKNSVVLQIFIYDKYEIINRQLHMLGLYTSTEGKDLQGRYHECIDTDTL